MKNIKFRANNKFEKYLSITFNYWGAVCHATGYMQRLIP